MEGKGVNTENTSDSLPIPPWKLQEERKMDIKPDASDEEIIKEKNQQSQKGNTSKKQLKRIGVLSLAKAYAVVGLTIGLVIALVYGIIFFLGSSIAEEFSSFEGLNNNLIQTYGSILIFAIPVIYAALGFLFGAISALGLNTIMKISGGIELEFEE